MQPATHRAAVLLTGVWAGALLAIAALAAPVAFANLAQQDAGRIAGQMFSIEARIGLGLAAVLILLLRQQARTLSDKLGAPLFSANLMLLLAAVFCTVAGHFALLPMMESARAGEAGLSFGALHGISAAFYAIKTLLVLVLTWRLAGR